jgi:hypothetical protein
MKPFVWWTYLTCNLEGNPACFLNEASISHFQPRPWQASDMRRWSDGRAKSFASSGGGGGGVLPAPAPPRSSPRHDLLAVVYAEFDNISGPVIRCQAPEG